MCAWLVLTVIAILITGICVLSLYRGTRHMHDTQAQSTDSISPTHNDHDTSLELPTFVGEPSVVVHNDAPSFTPEEAATTDIQFSSLDALGRCGVAIGLLGPDTLPTEQREPIGSVKPPGWHTVRYDDIIDDRYLYNRCHLIAHQLCGANDDPRNLITGTRYLNVEGMLPLENAIRAYIDKTGNHVLYKVTPMYEGENLLVSGVLIEARSREDNGDGISYSRYVFNVQPGITIDYATGESRIDESADSSSTTSETSEPESQTYVLNTNTMRFHLPDCPSVPDIKPKNRKEISGSHDEVIRMGYTPCGRCQP